MTTQNPEHERMKSRLADLRVERANGERLLADLEQQADALRDTLLRIGGAIQVIEELLETEVDQA